MEQGLIFGNSGRSSSQHCPPHPVRHVDLQDSQTDGRGQGYCGNDTRWPNLSVPIRAADDFDTYELPTCGVGTSANAFDKPTSEV